MTACRELFTREDLYDKLDPSQLRDLRSYFFRTAQFLIDAGEEITAQLQADGEEPKSRRKKVDLSWGIEGGEG